MLSSGRRAGFVVIAILLISGSSLPVEASGVVSSYVPPLTTEEPECSRLEKSYEDDEGDAHFIYTFKSGGLEDRIVPAKGFNPYTASAERLRKLGYPTRPTGEDDPLDLKEWMEIVQAPRNYGDSFFEPSCRLPGVQATYDTTNYNGYRASSPSGVDYYGAASSYTAPAYYLSQCVNETLADWVGVADTTRLAQAGVYLSQASGTAQGSAFYEFLGGPSSEWNIPLTAIASVPYRVGDRYYFEVNFVDANTWHVIVQDLTTGDLANFNYVGGNGGTFFIQERVYVVQERLYRSGANTAYMANSSARFRTARVRFQNSTYARVSIQNPEVTRMIGNSGVIGQPGALDVPNSNFNAYWEGCN